MDIINKEHSRLADIYDAIARAEADRKIEITRHNALQVEIEQERLEENRWSEKQELTQKLVDHKNHDPRKYLLEFTQHQSPYFGIVGINDEDKRIGQREYLLGHQSLMAGNRVAIVDWRTAKISRFFYDYEEGEDYEETIRNIDRFGIITKKQKVGIEQRILHRIETPQDTFEFKNDTWQKNGTLHSTADTKAAGKDHRMVDIVALISSDQFRMITKETGGALFITGGAGSGKTTVALHRLSYLQFNNKEHFRPERCMVLMFNRILKGYIQKTSESLLGKTAVETFSSWALTAMAALGVSRGKIVNYDDEMTTAKKNSRMASLLSAYIESNPGKIDLVMDLWRFYSQPEVIAFLQPGKAKQNELAEMLQDKMMRKERDISFNDVSVLVRLAQLRKPAGSVIQGALNWFDHITADEAQDFSQVELEAIMAATNERRSMTISADEKQKILSFVDEKGFANFKGKLNTLGLDKETLTISYRSAKEILDLAAMVSGREVDTANAPPGVVKFHAMASQPDAQQRLRELVMSLCQAEPNALTAVICKKKGDIKLIQQILDDINGLNKDETTMFVPGVTVINAHQVKGVEFSNVVLWNPSAAEYRQTQTDSNLLYVAITRACKRLDVVFYAKLATPLEKYHSRSKV